MACGSSLTVSGQEAGSGGDEVTSTGVGATAGTGGTGAAGGMAAGGGGGCAAIEVEHEGECFAEQRVRMWILGGESSVIAWAKTEVWSAQPDFEREIVAESGSCWAWQPAVQPTGPGYAYLPMDVGEISVQVGGGEVVALEPVNGDGSLMTMPMPVSGSGGEQVVVSLSGGVDAPAASLVVELGPPLAPSPPPLLEVGKDWTIGWSATEPPDQLSLRPQGKFANIRCTVEGETVTVDASLIDWVAPLPTPDVQGTLHRQDDFAEIDTGSGVVLQVGAARGASLSIPTVP